MQGTNLDCMFVLRCNSRNCLSMSFYNFLYVFVVKLCSFCSDCDEQLFCVSISFCNSLFGLVWHFQKKKLSTMYVLGDALDSRSYMTSTQLYYLRFFTHQFSICSRCDFDLLDLSLFRIIVVRLQRLGCLLYSCA